MYTIVKSLIKGYPWSLWFSPLFSILITDFFKIKLFKRFLEMYLL